MQVVIEDRSENPGHVGGTAITIGGVQSVLTDDAPKSERVMPFHGGRHPVFDFTLEESDRGESGFGGSTDDRNVEAAGKIGNQTGDSGKDFDVLMPIELCDFEGGILEASDLGFEFAADRLAILTGAEREFRVEGENPGEETVPIEKLRRVLVSSEGTSLREVDVGAEIEGSQIVSERFSQRS